MNLRHIKKRLDRGFSLLEVLVGLAILTAGLVAAAAIFPQILDSQRDAELLTVAAALAQLKVEEVRRTNDRNDRLIDEIKSLANPTEPVAFANETRLAYSYSGVSVLYPAFENPGDPRAAPGVPRVIIRYAPTYRSTQDVVYELRFNTTP